MAHFHVKGHGLEIGAMATPTNLPVGSRACYVDVQPPTSYRKQSEYAPYPLVDPVIVDDAETRKRTLRMFMKEKLDNYVVDLRRNQFEVVVYDDELTRQFQGQADFIAELSEKAVQEGSVTEQRQQDLQKWITPPQE